MGKKEKEEKNTGLTVLKSNGYALAQFTAKQLIETIKENFGDEELTPNDLDRVRIPSGGGTAWSIPALDGSEEMAKTICGVIVYYRPVRAFWELSYDEGGGGCPPDCSSKDGKIGIGTPGGTCGTCALNKFGSDGGRGKACKEMRLLFVLTPESLLPLMVVLPPTSIQPMKQFMTRLTARMIRYNKVQVEIGLKEALNKDNIKFTHATFTVKTVLDDESAAHISAYSQSMRSAFEAIDIDIDIDMNNVEGSEPNI